MAPKFSLKMPPLKHYFMGEAEDGSGFIVVPSTPELEKRWIKQLKKTFRKR